MSRRRKDPLRALTADERSVLEQIARAYNEPASHVARAKALLAVADGQRSYVAAARAAGRKSNDAVSHLVSRFNQEGLAAIEPHASPGAPPTYTVVERECILVEARRTPERERDGTATWSLSTLQRALRAASDGLPKVSTYTLWIVLHEAGFAWQKSRTWCETGHVKRKRKSGTVANTDPDAEAKSLIEQAYQVGEATGLAVWCHDQAGPYPTRPYDGESWQPEGHPARQSSDYVRDGTAKLLTLFHPLDGHVDVTGVTHCPNAVLHPWLKEHLTTILAQLPHPTRIDDPLQTRQMWQKWQTGLTVHFTLPDSLPPLRMLLILDNLTGHKTPSFVLWLVEHGIMPVYTPLSGSWLNMAESIQRIVVRRALAGQHPQTPRRSSLGWKRWRRIGTQHRRPLCGAASAPLVVPVNGSIAMLWVAQALAPDARSPGN